MIILSIDPGETSTGVVILNAPPAAPAYPVYIAHVTGGVQGFIAWLKAADSITGVRGISHIVCEKFIPDGRASKPGEFEPLRIEGALLALWSEDGITFQKNDVRNTVTDAALKRAGLWLTGEDVDWKDANDSIAAMKHGIAWLKNNDHRPTIEALWPKP